MMRRAELRQLFYAHVRELAADLGVCIYCWRNDAAPGHTLCTACLEFHRRLRRVVILKGKV